MHLPTPPPAPPPGACRIAFVADVHVGNHGVMGGPRVVGVNRRAAETLAILRAAYDRAVELGASAFVVAGDLFDVDDPEPQLLAEVADILAGPIPTVLLVGNHDQHTNAPGDHALGPLAAVPGIRVVDRPEAVVVYPRNPPPGQPRTVRPGATGAVLLCVPFVNARAATVITDALAELAARPGLHAARVCVVAHAGGIDDATPVFLRDAHDALPVERLNIILDTATRPPAALAVLGNWHQHRAWAFHADAAGAPYGTAEAPHANVVVQCGALVPTGFDNPGAAPGLYGSLIVWDTPADGAPPEADADTTPRVYRIEIAGPRFVTLTLRRADVGPPLTPSAPGGDAARAAAAVLARLRAAATAVAAPIYLTVRAPLTDPEAAEVRRALAGCTAPALGGSRVEVLPPDLTAPDAPAAAPGDTPAGEPGDDGPPVEDAATLAAMLHGSDALHGAGLGALAAGYCAAMPLPPGVNRQHVTATVLRLLG